MVGTSVGKHWSSSCWVFGPEMDKRIPDNSPNNLRLLSVYSGGIENFAYYLE